MIPSPKSQFQGIKGATTKHRELVESEAFQRALLFAEQQYNHRLCVMAPSDIDSSSNAQAAAACFQRLLGVHEFIDTFINLSEKPQKLAPLPGDNLDHLELKQPKK